jgi:hypothetical protein
MITDTSSIGRAGPSRGGVGAISTLVGVGEGWEESTSFGVGEVGGVISIKTGLSYVPSVLEISGKFTFDDEVVEYHSHGFVPTSRHCWNKK